MNVLVLGGGPAGAAAAITLRQADVRTTLVEPARFPRYRPGETLHPGIEPLLERLGTIRHILAAGYLRHTGSWVAWNAPRRFVPFGRDSDGPWRGFQAPRADFDARLLRAAADAGTVVHRWMPTALLRDRDGRVRGVRTTREALYADYVIDCTGSSRWLARALSLRIRAHSPRLVARFGYARGELDEEFPSLEADKHGWTWMAEVAPGRYHWLRVTEPDTRPPRTWKPAALAALDHEASRGAVVTWRIAERTAGPGWLLAGDAAVALDPSSSHGVLRAIMSGMMAAHVIAANSPGSYHDWLAEWFHHDATEMRRSYHAAGLFGC